MIGKVAGHHNRERQHESDGKVACMVRQLITITEKVKKLTHFNNISARVLDVIYQTRKTAFHHIPNTGKVFGNVVKP